MCVYRDPALNSILGVTAARTSPRLPTSDERAHRYSVASGFALQDWDFQMALGCLKLAVIAAGIDYRQRSENGLPEPAATPSHPDCRGVTAVERSIGSAALRHLPCCRHRVPVCVGTDPRQLAVEATGECVPDLNLEIGVEKRVWCPAAQPPALQPVSFARVSASSSICSRGTVRLASPSRTASSAGIRPHVPI